jgi:sRNA-binding carbon storage regulator CsrA
MGGSSMLILSRKAGESLCISIGSSLVQVHVDWIAPSRVRLVIDAADDVRVVRGGVHECPDTPKGNAHD